MASLRASEGGPTIHPRVDRARLGPPLTLEAERWPGSIRGRASSSDGREPAKESDASTLLAPRVGIELNQSLPLEEDPKQLLGGLPSEDYPEELLGLPAAESPKEREN